LFLTAEFFLLEMTAGKATFPLALRINAPFMKNWELRNEIIDTQRSYACLYEKKNFEYIKSIRTENAADAK
jgi:hypothetical protein